MAIRSVVSRGFGNDTYSPGISKVATRGYAVPAYSAVGGVTIGGAFCSGSAVVPFSGIIDVIIGAVTVSGRESLESSGGMFADRVIPSMFGDQMF